MRHHLMLAARVLLPILALVLLAQRLGSAAFRPALDVVAPVPLLAGLGLGGVAVVAQSARWRVLMVGAGLPLEGKEAMAECYRAAALNSVLPGGVAGDVLRAWRQRARAPQGWRPAAGTVLADRTAGLCLLLGTAAVALLVEWHPVVAAAAGGGSLVAWAVTRPLLRPLDRRERTAVWGWSALALACLLGLAAVVAATLGTPVGPGAAVVLGLALLAGMAVPLNLGGWGPREAAGAFAALLVGAPAADGVAVAAGYGLLSTVSVLPGFVVLAWAVRRGPGQVELDAGVLAEDETT